jgi:biopolymer transport protein ExbD
MPVRAPRAGLPRRRPPASTPRLALGNLIDVLLVVLVFLLSTYEASSDCCLRRPIERPAATAVTDLVDAPTVAVDASGAITLDGGAAGSTAGPAGAVARLDELFDVLRAKAALWRQVHPRARFPGVLLFDLDRGLPAGAVKSLVLTARSRRHAHTSFIVDDVR